MVVGNTANFGYRHDSQNKPKYNYQILIWQAYIVINPVEE